MKYYILESWDGVLFFVGNANPENTIINGKLVAYTTNYYRWYSEYENRTPYTPSTLGVEGFYSMSVLTSSGEPFTEVTEEDFRDEMAYYRKRGMLVTNKVVKPLKKGGTKMEIKEKEQIIKSFRKIARICKQARMRDNEACYDCPLFSVCKSVSLLQVSPAHFDGII